MRTTVRTEMNDAMLVRRALDALAIKFEEQGSTFTLHGAAEGVVIDVTSGRVQAAGEVGLDAGVVGRLRQHYAEQKFVLEAERQGVVVQARELNASGSIVLRCQIAAPSAPLVKVRSEVDAGVLDQEWYEPETGRVDRVALVYFRDICTNVLRRATNRDPDLSEAKRRQTVEKARSAVAERLGKTVGQLDQVDLLEDTEARFKVLTACFSTDLGEVAWPAKLSDDERVIWRKVGKQHDYVMTVLVVYPTDRQGAIDEERLSSGCRVLRWRFEPQTFELFRKIDRGLRKDGETVVGSDVYVTCAGSRSRKVKVTLAGPAMYRRDATLKRAVLEEAVATYEKLRPFRTMTTEEVREQLASRSR